MFTMMMMMICLKHQSEELSNVLNMAQYSFQINMLLPS